MRSGSFASIHARPPRKPQGGFDRHVGACGQLASQPDANKGLQLTTDSLDVPDFGSILASGLLWHGVDGQHCLLQLNADPLEGGSISIRPMLEPGWRNYSQATQVRLLPNKMLRRTG